MKAVLVSLLLTLFISCDYFDKQKVTSEEILEEELEAFNWNEVDQYPTFNSCDSISGKQNKRDCFERTLQSYVNKKLLNQTFIVDEDVSDMVKMIIEIDKEGLLSVDSIEMNQITREQIPQLDSLLKWSLDSLPKIFPAIKRSQQVSTRFVLPIEISIQ